MTKEITDSEFEAEVVNSKEPVLVDFWAPWCGPCKMLTPILDQLSEEMAGSVKVVKMNIDDNPEIPSKFNIRSIPTLMIFKDGKSVASKLGALPKNSIKAWIDSSI
ncbi:MAG: thioredoxin [Rickettsiales bacterium]|nr:MAG: thioredoxin [Rickettsiales bacterium]